MTAPVPVLRRDTRHKVTAGGCAGIARRYGLSRNGLRLAFVVSCLLPGPQFVAYLLLLVIMPAGDRYREGGRELTSCCCPAAGRAPQAARRPGRRPRRPPPAARGS